MFMAESALLLLLHAQTKVHRKSCLQRLVIFCICANGRRNSIASDCLVDLDTPVQDKLSDLVHLCLGIKQQQQNKLSYEPSQACCMH